MKYVIKCHILSDILNTEHWAGHRSWNDFVHPVAQLLERWSPGGENPCSSRSGVRCMSVLTAWSAVGGSRCGQLKSVEFGLDEHIKLWISKSPDNPILFDRTVAVRTRAASSLEIITLRVNLSMHIYI